MKGIPDEMVAEWVRRGLVKPTPSTVSIIDERQDEKAFQAEVVKYAKRNGFMVYHTHNSRRSEPGFPDLVLIRERLVVAELKVGDGKLTAAQANWLDSFRAAGVETHEWRPDDWGTILDVLAANGGPVSGQ